MTTEPETTPESADRPAGPGHRRGPFRAGERVQLTDVKGRHHTVHLTHDGYFQSQRGSFHHRDLIGRDEGTVLATPTGHDLLALRPLLSDYVMSMPRGAAVVYPKDAGQIVQMGDIYPGARVVEAGVGSGALSMSLLSAIGETGTLHSVERRPEFAEIAEANVDSWFGGRHPAWTVTVGDLADVLLDAEPGSVDRIVLDMLAPWENIGPAAHALAPGGLLIAYVATTTQLSRVVEDLRGSGRFTEPRPWEAMVRGWHVEGLSVRPDHRMVAHTGFLVTARALADGSAPPQRTRRPAKGAGPLGAGAHGHAADLASGAGPRPASDDETRDTTPDDAAPPAVDPPRTSTHARTSRHAPPVGVDSGAPEGDAKGWAAALSAGERTISVKKLRRVGRDVRRRAEIEESGYASRPAAPEENTTAGTGADDAATHAPDEGATTEE
ncbi:tRNA (adenine-N1)-methyltransferase [Georgenia sp. Z1344]|uniref:tRNA (adenine-N1)-methyltransferase n=1 Tax=Georgenia sp. Z1344 TaxID=3416706 RepID=UPI003CFB5ABA